jgi:hypothetical protein
VKTVCVDLDGVLAAYSGWKGIEHIGDPLPGAVEFTHAVAEFARVLVYTSRCRSNPGGARRAVPCEPQVRGGGEFATALARASTLCGVKR